MLTWGAFERAGLASFRGSAPVRSAASSRAASFSSFCILVCRLRSFLPRGWEASWAGPFLLTGGAGWEAAAGGCLGLAALLAALLVSVLAGPSLALLVLAGASAVAGGVDSSSGALVRPGLPASTSKSLSVTHVGELKLCKLHKGSLSLLS